MRWGIIDMTDDCWLGDDEGPKLFDDRELARIAAQVLEMQAFGTDLAARFQAKEFLPRSLRLKDEIDTRMDALEALRRIEGLDDGTKEEPIALRCEKKGWSFADDEE